MIATTRIHIPAPDVDFFHRRDAPNVDGATTNRCGRSLWPGYRFKNSSRAASSAASAAVRVTTPLFLFDIPHPDFIFLKSLLIPERESRIDNAKVNFIR